MAAAWHPQYRVTHAWWLLPIRPVLETQTLNSKTCILHRPQYVFESPYRLNHGTDSLELHQFIRNVVSDVQRSGAVVKKLKAKPWILVRLVLWTKFGNLCPPSTNIFYLWLSPGLKSRTEPEDCQVVQQYYTFIWNLHPTKHPKNYLQSGNSSYLMFGYHKGTRFTPRWVTAVINCSFWWVSLCSVLECISSILNYSK